MSYSNDSSVWFFYKDINHYEPKIFGGNMDKNTERRHYLNTPITARYVRFHPVSWHRKIGLRAGIIGCRYKGDCGAGFMQVNSGSSCSKYKIQGYKSEQSDFENVIFIFDFKLCFSNLVKMQILTFAKFAKLIIWTISKT